MTDALVVAVVGWFIVPNNNVCISTCDLKKNNRYKSTKEKSNT